MSIHPHLFCILICFFLSLEFSSIWSFTPRLAIKPQTHMGAMRPIMAASRGGGGTQLDSKTIQKTATKPTYKEEIEKDWRLILHDDPVHTIQQVVEIINSCCPLCTGPRAYEVTLEVHMSGAGTVAVANKKIISEYCKALQVAGLTVSMSPDDEFEDEDGDEE